MVEVSFPKWGQHDLYGKPHNISGNGVVTRCHPDCKVYSAWRSAWLASGEADPEGGAEVPTDAVE